MWDMTSCEVQIQSQLVLETNEVVTYYGSVQTAEGASTYYCSCLCAEQSETYHLICSESQ